MKENEQVCGTCKWNKPSWETGKLCGFSCANEDSDAYSIDTAYDDSCELWEERS